MEGVYVPNRQQLEKPAAYVLNHGLAAGLYGYILVPDMF
jgi:hypothetical protein